MTSHLLATVSAPAWGASSAPRGARRGALADLLGGGAILLAWLFLWSWFALAMVQPVPRAAPSGAAVARGHIVPPDTSRSFRTEATPQRAPQAAQTS